MDYKTIQDQNKPRLAPLDPNHSHFILVDNSQLGKYGGEIEFRAELESAISQHKFDPDEEQPLSTFIDSIPIVLLVLEGGPNTVGTVLSSVKRKTPCVFVEVFQHSSLLIIK
jgi:hypothetical protein